MPIKDYRDDVASADAMAKAAKDLADTIDTSMKAGALVWEYYYTITQALPVSLALSGLRLSAPAAKAKVGDLVFIHPADRPKVGALTLGFIFVQSTGFVFVDGAVDVNCVLPPISAIGTLSVPLRLRGFRPPAV
ncbi:hypothetical protein C8J36_103518 [Rhizobium sp. PP-F2F-G48]|uniref:hypothetical protein n=1 Tax=Rhizobium sp. PP-F2F-G48 TaxID=2135651 RepID=UPI001042CA50|nr:hypothetical protein [Rhizobium sp. PP-F2F-G48]TCM56148.1 hypothetical protein C8J36_103518 [Rhizobium sp. PP-F2F-G48]